MPKSTSIPTEEGKVPFDKANIKVAYNVTGAVPKRGIWFNEVGVPPCGCPAGVFVLHFYGRKALELCICGRGMDQMARFASQIGVSESDLEDFTLGFDDRDDIYHSESALCFGEDMRLELIKENASNGQ